MPACHECRFWDAKAGPNLGYCRRRSRDALACALEMEQWTGPKKQPD
jgi:hypothetical protein